MSLPWRERPFARAAELKLWLANTVERVLRFTMNKRGSRVDLEPLEKGQVATTFVLSSPNWLTTRTAIFCPFFALKEAFTTNHQPPTTNQQPPTTNQQPTTTNQQPTTNNHQPTTNQPTNQWAPPTFFDPCLFPRVYPFQRAVQY